jgi:hypothetical protein
VAISRTYKTARPKFFGSVLLAGFSNALGETFWQYLCDSGRQLIVIVLEDCLSALRLIQTRNALADLIVPGDQFSVYFPRSFSAVTSVRN